jgi:hypothetical protein
MFLLWIALAVSLWSAVDYFAQARESFEVRPRPAVAKSAAAR